MKRFLGIACALFFAVVAIALTGADSSAVAGLGCHGRARCHGRVHRCHRHGLCHRRHRCHGQQAVSSCESCSSCSGGCADGNCSGDAVIIEEGTPTEAAPEAPAAPKKNKKKKEKAA